MHLLQSAILDERGMYLTLQCCFALYTGDITKGKETFNLSCFHCSRSCKILWTYLQLIKNVIVHLLPKKKKLQFIPPEDLVCVIFSFCVLVFKFHAGFHAKVEAILVSISLHSLRRGACTVRLLSCVVDVCLLNSTNHSARKHKFTLSTFIIQTA